MTDKILHAVADLPKVMPQIEIPIQSGDNDGAGKYETWLHARAVS